MGLFTLSRNLYYIELTATRRGRVDRFMNIDFWVYLLQQSVITEKCQTMIENRLVNADTSNIAALRLIQACIRTIRTARISIQKLVTI